MPQPYKYLDGFGLEKGSYANGYYLSNISIDHVTIKRYNQYQYPITLTWEIYDETSDHEKLSNTLITYLQGDRIIYSEYGNPYRCNFGELKIDKKDKNKIIMSSTGTCQRI